MTEGGCVVQDSTGVTGLKESGSGTLIVCDRGLAVCGSRHHWCRRVKESRLESTECM